LLGIAVMLPILALTIGTVAYLRRVARATGSLVVKSDALHCEVPDDRRCAGCRGSLMRTP